MAWDSGSGDWKVLNWPSLNIFSATVSAFFGSEGGWGRGFVGLGFDV